MSNRFRLLIAVLAVLAVANVGWRIWASWGLITIDADDTPTADVVRSVEKQSGIRLKTNLPADSKVTMHVKKVPLLHALEILSANTGASWNVAYISAPDKGTIENALARYSSGEKPEGWKTFSLPMPRMQGMGGDFDRGASDPRQDEWKTQPAPENSLHAYLEQASHTVGAQFWAPETWNPNIAAPPKTGTINKVLPKLVKSANGQSAEVFLLSGRGRPQREVAADSGEAPANRERRPGGPGFGFAGGGPSEEMRKAMEERIRAQIDKLPADKKAEALAELEERKKFFEELAQLSPEERRAKFQEKMEQDMNNGAKAARMDAGMTKRGAMQTADQRADRYRSYLDRKRQAN